jgi:hypothetical protein
MDSTANVIGQQPDESFVAEQTGRLAVRYVLDARDALGVVQRGADFRTLVAISGGDDPIDYIAKQRALWHILREHQLSDVYEKAAPYQPDETARAAARLGLTHTWCIELTPPDAPIRISCRSRPSLADRPWSYGMYAIRANARKAPFVSREQALADEQVALTGRRKKGRRRRN